MQTHIKVLAVLHIAFGALGLIFGLIVLLAMGGISAIVGLNAHNGDAAVAIPILGLIGGIIFVIAVATSIPGLIAGIGLLSYKPWARILTLILSGLQMLNFPFGTALGVYGFWVLLSQEGTNAFAVGPSYYLQR